MKAGAACVQQVRGFIGAALFGTAWLPLWLWALFYQRFSVAQRYDHTSCRIVDTHVVRSRLGVTTRYVPVWDVSWIDTAGGLQTGLIRGKHGDGTRLGLGARLGLNALT
jgi:hypothetical protein